MSAVAQRLPLVPVSPAMEALAAMEVLETGVWAEVVPTRLLRPVSDGSPRAQGLATATPNNGSGPPQT